MVNFNKNREISFDFWRKKRPSQPLRIRKEAVKEVEDYKNLEVATGL